jgi:RNA polymerase sigma factor (sigma-70 family)
VFFATYINETINGRFSMKTPDEILVQRVLEGDKSSFGILVERYRRFVFLQSIKTTRNFHEAEDITQDVFAEAYLNLHSLREPAKFGSWLQGITQNLCRMWLRKKQILSDLEIPLDNLQTEVIEQCLEQEKSESWEFGTDVLTKLSDEQKALLKLFYINNRSCRHIAECLGASEAAVRQRLSRARQQVKSELLEGGKDMNSMIAISAIYVILGSSVFSVLAGTWKDNFKDGNFDGWEIDKLDWPAAVLVPGAGNWRVEDGIVIGGDDNNKIAHLLTTGDVSWTDYTAEVSVKFSKELRNCGIWSGVYLRVRCQERLPYMNYCLGIQNFGDNAVKQILVEGGKMAMTPVEVAGGMIMPEQPNDTTHIFPKALFKIEADRWYRLKVTVKGNLVKCFIDGKRVSEFQSDLYPSGKVGVSVDGVVAMFDDFVVTGPEIPDGGTSFAVNPQAKLATTWEGIKSR